MANVPSGEPARVAVDRVVRGALGGQLARRPLHEDRRRGAGDEERHDPLERADGVSSSSTAPAVPPSTAATASGSSRRPWPLQLRAGRR